jgi:fructose/tagatose bisphosphate aldolase
MTTKEKFNNVEICIESQLLNLKYDENMNFVDECIEIADEFAIGFLEFEVGLLTKQVEGYFYFDYDAEWRTSKELLEIYKKTLE